MPLLYSGACAGMGFLLVSQESHDAVGVGRADERCVLLRLSAALINAAGREQTGKRGLLQRSEEAR